MLDVVGALQCFLSCFVSLPWRTCGRETVVLAGRLPCCLPCVFLHTPASAHVWHALSVDWAFVVT